jgi:hypothetical protein
MPRKPQQQENSPLAMLGLEQDPIQQMMGLVQLLTAMDQPDQVNRELDMRQQAQDQQVLQFQAQQKMGQAELNQRQQVQSSGLDQWAQEFAFKQQLAEQERLMQVEQLRQDQAYRQQASALQLLGIAPDLQSNGLMQNPSALFPALQTAGAPGLMSFAAPQGAPNLTPDQQVLWQSRQKLFPQ